MAIPKAHTGPLQRIRDQGMTRWCGFCCCWCCWCVGLGGLIRTFSAIWIASSIADDPDGVDSRSGLGGASGEKSFGLTPSPLTTIQKKCKGNYIVYHSPLSTHFNLPPHRVTRMDMGEKNCNPVLLSTTMDAAPTHPIHCPSELGFDGIVFISVRQARDPFAKRRPQQVQPSMARSTSHDLLVPNPQFLRCPPLILFPVLFFFFFFLFFP